MAQGDSPNKNESGKSVRKKDKFPWLLLLLLLGSIYFFWILPYQLGPRPVQVEFAGDEPGRR